MSIKYMLSYFLIYIIIKNILIEHINKFDQFGNL
jgi:hypothetical protein